MLQELAFVLTPLLIAVIDWPLRRGAASRPRAAWAVIGTRMHCPDALVLAPLMIHENLFFA